MYRIAVWTEHWSVLCPLLCGLSHSAASKGSHMCQLALNSHMEFLTASIMNVAVSLAPVCRLPASLRTHPLLYRKYTPIPFSKQAFSNKASCTGFTSHVSCPLSHLLESSVSHFGYLVAQGVWMRQLPEEQMLFHCVSELGWSQAGASFSQNLMLHQAFILNSGIQESVVKTVGPKWLYASKFRQAAYHRHSGLFDIGP